jgi:hypothetical protein
MHVTFVYQPAIELSNALIAATKEHHELIELSRLMDIVKQRLGTEFKPADHLFFDQLREVRALLRSPQSS